MAKSDHASYRKNRKAIAEDLFAKALEDGNAPEVAADIATFTVERMVAGEAIWDLPIEKRQAAYDALKEKYGDMAPAMSGPGLKD